MPFCYWKSSNFKKGFLKLCLLGAFLMDNFAVCHRQLGMSEQVHHWVLLCIDVECTFVLFFKFFIAETKGSPPFPKSKDR